MAPARDIAIVGFSETRIELRSGRHVYELAGEAFSSLLESTGVGIEEIDGFAASSCFSDVGNPFQTPMLTAYLGLELNWSQLTDLGGSSCVGSVARAAAAIRSGLCETVALVFADAQSSENKQNYGLFRNEWQYPVGTMGPPGYFGMLTNRYVHQHGPVQGALARLAVAQRNHALMNDLACEKLKKPLTTEEYLASPMISDPIRMLDCVMVCDGASALLMTTTARAKAMGAKRIVHPIGYGERLNFDERNQTPDITIGGHSVAGPKALKQAGMSPKDVHMLHPYDDFLIAVLLQLEHMGFCERGKGAAYLMDTDISHTGKLPINTGGGQISAGQAGLAGGGHNLVEAVRQLMGQGGKRQVKNASNALVTGIGWIPYGRNWAASTALVLEAA